MNTPSRISLSAPHEFLSYVPALVGFQPVDSVVLVAFRDQGTCGAMRLDLAAFTNPRTSAAAADKALDGLCRIPRVTGVLPVIYTSRQFSESGRAPHEDVAAVLSSQIEGHGLEVVDMLCVAADAWGGYLDDSCLGHDRTMVTEPESLPGRGLLDAADELSLPAVSADEREAFARASAALEQHSDDYEEYTFSGEPPMEGPEAPALTGPEFAAGLASYVDEGATVLDAELALISRLIDEPALRDVIAYSWAWGAEAGAHLWRRVFAPEQFITDSEDDPWMYAFAGRIEVRPDPDRLRRSIRLLKSVCARSRPDDRAPALTLISWCYWALGLGSFAGAWQRDALDVDGTYGLALILGMMLDAGTIPDWAFTDPEELNDAHSARGTAQVDPAA